VGNLATQGCSMALLQYMRCEVFVFGGATNAAVLTSFLWVGGNFVGDGYMLDPPASGGIDDATLLHLLASAGADMSCGPSNAAVQCDSSALATNSARITSVCCPIPTQCNPWPTTCSSGCLAVWQPFWQQCYGSIAVGMAQDEQNLRGLTAFATSCRGNGSWGHDDGSGAASAGDTGLAHNFIPRCGPHHATCSYITGQTADGLPVGVWDIEHCVS
jgi:hypothetical protein